MNTKRNIAIVIAAALVVGLVYYRDSVTGYLASKGISFSSENAVLATRELSTVVTYKAPNGDDTVKFSLFVDRNGVITDVKSLNMADPADANLLKFNAGLLTVIKGKKLSDISAVDKIGTSSLTTDAFNSALAKLKTQL